MKPPNNPIYCKAYRNNQTNKQPQQERNAAAVAIPWARNRDPADLVAGASGRPGEGGTEMRASRSASSSHPTRKSRSAQQQQLPGGWQEVKTGEWKWKETRVR